MRLALSLTEPGEREHANCLLFWAYCIIRALLEERRKTGGGGGGGRGGEGGLKLKPRPLSSPGSLSALYSERWGARLYSRYPENAPCFRERLKVYSVAMSPASMEWKMTLSFHSFPFLCHPLLSSLLLPSPLLAFPLPSISSLLFPLPSSPLLATLSSSLPSFYLFSPPLSTYQ